MGMLKPPSLTTPRLTARPLGEADAADLRRINDNWCLTLWSNLGSRGVMRRLGFAPVGPVVCAGLPHILCRRRLDGPGVAS